MYQEGLEQAVNLWGLHAYSSTTTWILARNGTEIYQRLVGNPYDGNFVQKSSMRPVNILAIVHVQIDVSQYTSVKQLIVVYEIFIVYRGLAYGVISENLSLLSFLRPCWFRTVEQLVGIYRVTPLNHSLKWGELVHSSCLQRKFHCYKKSWTSLVRTDASSGGHFLRSSADIDWVGLGVFMYDQQLCFWQL